MTSFLDMEFEAKDARKKKFKLLINRITTKEVNNMDKPEKTERAFSQDMLGSMLKEPLIDRLYRTKRMYEQKLEIANKAIWAIEKHPEVVGVVEAMKEAEKL